jgi:hypothetical protein
MPRYSSAMPAPPAAARTGNSFRLAGLASPGPYDMNAAFMLLARVCY